MIVRDEVKGLSLFLKLDRGLHHPKEVAEVKSSRRLNAGQNSHAPETSDKSRAVKELVMRGGNVNGQSDCSCMTECSISNGPQLKPLAYFLRPVRFRASHENLSPTTPCRIEQRQKTAPPAGVEFTHDIIDEQDRGGAVDAG